MEVRSLNNQPPTWYKTVSRSLKAAKKPLRDIGESTPDTLTYEETLSREALETFGLDVEKLDGMYD